MNDSFRRKFRVSSILAGGSVLLALIISYVLFKPQFDVFEAKTLDWRYQARIQNAQKDPSQTGTIEEIVIVDIDNRSLEKMGRYQQWSRAYHADMIHYLAQAGALAVVFDIMFLEADQDSSVDRQLTRATADAMNVVHAFSFSPADPDAFLYRMTASPSALDSLKFSFSCPENARSWLPKADRMDGELFPLYNAASRIGFVNFQPDNDSVIRRMPLFYQFADRCYPSLAMAAVMHLLNISPEHIRFDGRHAVLLTDVDDRTIRIPIDSHGRLLINFKGPFKTFRYVSYYDVYEKRVPPEFFTDKVVLIGASAAGLSDIRPVPFQGAFPGVEINANVICNILTNDYIRVPSVFITLLVLCGVVFIVTLSAGMLRTFYSLPLAIGFSGLLVYIAFLLFTTNSTWVEIVRPTFAIWLGFLVVIIYRYQIEQKEKRFIKNVFQFYMSASVVNEILKQPKMLSLGGDRKIATAFFSDIKNFTTISEQMDPEDLVALLNEYFAVMTDIVLRHEGYLNKYQGDAIIALYGIPITQDDHALRACYTALDMQQELKKLHEKWQQQNLPALKVRIGINSGPMVVGNIGGEKRFDYTAIGDSVNLASRLESANKMYGTDIIISEDTFRLVSEKLWVRELDFIRVKGKHKPVRIYEVLGRKTEKLNPVHASSLEYFVQGLELYRQRNWVAAYDWFQKALQLTPYDGPAQEFIRRCKIFIENPRPDDWDGVFNLRSK